MIQTSEIINRIYVHVHVCIRTRDKVPVVIIGMVTPDLEVDDDDVCVIFLLV